MLKYSGKPNRQVERTRSWIFDAVMILMDEKPYNKITVSDICEKAGIARPTFYYNFDDKDEVILQYLNNSFNTELTNMEKTTDDKQNNIVLTFNVSYMTNHQKNLKKILSTADVEARIYRELQAYTLTLIKSYKKQLSAEEYQICRYKICYQLTGSLKILFDWFINGMPMPVEKLILMLNTMNIPKTVQYRNIPGVEVRIKSE